MSLKISRVCFCRLLLAVGMLLCAVEEGYGQDKKRKYANRQEFHGKALLGLLLPGTIANAGSAVDQDPKTFSTLSVTAGVLNQMLATQFLDFGTVNPIPAGTPVTVKLTLPASTLGLVDNFRIQPYTNLNYGGGILGIGDHWRANAAGAEFQGANLLNLLSGKGSVEFTIVPTAGFKGIWIEVGSVVGLGVSMDVYHAYVIEDAMLACDEKDKAIDVLTGVRAGLAGIANATGSVTNPWNIIDGNESTYAEISTGVQLVSEIFHTTIFQTPSKPNQVAKVVLQGAPSGLGGLLDLSLLTGLVIQPYLGTVPVGVPINKATLLSLRLLPESTDKFELAVPVEGVFDRIEIKLGGVAEALNSLRVYEVVRLPALPILDGGDIIIEKDYQICERESVSLTASAPTGSTLNWYENQDGGLSIGAGITFNTGNLSESKTYYVSAKPTGCTTESIRLPIHVHVSPIPSNPNLSISNIND